MGNKKGNAHEKRRKYLVGDERERLLARNAEAFEKGIFLTQAQLAQEFGMSQGAVSKILRNHGSRTRTREEASPTTVDVEKALKLYTGNPKMSVAKVAEELGRPQSVVRVQLAKHVEMHPQANYAKYEFDRNFFAEVDPIRAYFAGFIAADGFISESGLYVNFGIHPQDVEILENLKKFADLPQEIRLAPNNKGKLYNWLTICSVDWVKDLERHYNIVYKKSLILEPPNFTDETLIWHFIRGFIDGDGHIKASGTAVQFVTASSKFRDWMLGYLGIANSMYEMSWTVEEEQGPEEHSAWSCWYTGEAATRNAENIYRHSTPETRLSRKYLRAQPLLEKAKLMPDTKKTIYCKFCDLSHTINLRSYNINIARNGRYLCQREGGFNSGSLAKDSQKLVNPYESEGKKECTRCLAINPLSEFGERKEASDGKSPICKDCVSEKSKQDYLQRLGSRTVNQEHLPRHFVWTKYGTEAGESIEQIVDRKNREREANGGIFYWGIGNALGPSLKKLLQVEDSPEVLFSPMVGATQPKDKTSDGVLLWKSGKALDKSRVSIPESVTITSRKKEVKTPTHYALVCYSEEPLVLGANVGILAPKSLRTILHDVVPGASQNTSVVRRDEVVLSRTYDVTFRAKLVPPYFVELENPVEVLQDLDKTGE